MLLWIPVLEKFGTYNEVANIWDVNELFDALEILEYRRQSEDFHKKQAEQQNKMQRKR